MKNLLCLLALLAAEPSFGGQLRRNLSEFRRLQADDIIATIPNNIRFSLDNNDFAQGDVCNIGCEGDYSQITRAFDNLWDSRRKEYELFFMVKGRFAVAAGVIYNNFPNRVEQLRRNHPEVDTIILPYCPGSANDDAMIPGATRVHELGYQTCVPSDGMVASGGTDFFAAGVKRYATPGSEVGIHSWAAGNGQSGSDLPRDHPEHRQYLNFYSDVCIPQDFYWETLSHGLPMHYITETEFQRSFPYLRDCTGTCRDSGGGGGADDDETDDGTDDNGSGGNNGDDGSASGNDDGTDDFSGGPSSTDDFNFNFDDDNNNDNDDGGSSFDDDGRFDDDFRWDDDWGIDDWWGFGDDFRSWDDDWFS